MQCTVCGGLDFYNEDGYFFCQECQTQNQEVREEVLEVRVDASTRLRKTKIRREKSGNSDGQELGWTSWEYYNFILIGLANELVELGVTSHVKLTILQLWAAYLGKMEVAFTSTKKKFIPKLSRRFHKRDAGIIYGKVQQQKKKRKRKRENSISNASSVVSGQFSETSSTREINRNKRLMVTAEYERFMSSQGSSEGGASSVLNQSINSLQSSQSKPHIHSEYAEKIRFNANAKEEARKIKNVSVKVPKSKRFLYQRKHVTTQYKISPQVITPMKLWAIIYLALRIHKENVHLADMLRYGREGHLSYYKLDHLLPPEISIAKGDMTILSQVNDITHKGMRQLSASMAKFLNIYELFCPDFLPLITQYCQELRLPRGVLLYAERLIALSPPVMSFNVQKPYIPNYEGRAMAFIIVILKVLFALDGITEYQISRLAEKINSRARSRGLSDPQLFSFREWQRYIECRRSILVNSQFSMKLKYEPDLPGTSHLYLQFLKSIHSKRSGNEPPVTDYKHFLSQELKIAMKNCVGKLNATFASQPNVNVFAPSLTPQYAYLEQLLSQPFQDFPAILQTDFYKMKVGYITKPDLLKELATQCGINLKVVYSGMNFLEKVVPEFEPTKMPSVKELNEHVVVEELEVTKNEFDSKSEDLNEYLHRDHLGRIKIDPDKKDAYDRVRSIRNENDSTAECSEDFLFDEVSRDGKLLIPAEGEEELEERGEENGCEVRPNQEGEDILSEESRKRYNLELSSYEEMAILQPETVIGSRRSTSKIKLYRNAKGRFVRASKFKEVGKGLEEEGSCRENGDARKSRKMVQKRLENGNCRERKNRGGTTQIQRENGVTVDPEEAEILSDAVTPSCDDVDVISRDSDGCLDSEINEASIIREIDESCEMDEPEVFFRPSGDYWMYHCVFSRVKTKNFELFERDLPVSFRWLLNECANVVEMTAEDLYEEVCTVESYHTRYLNSNRENSEYRAKNFKPKAYRSNMQSKW
ncbi:TATA box-binding protein-associated factor RNA polymerase I subunit B [Orussus abietinus]|uniref:TATA box-binding protein-associated factor RNA polymerase I subunit B n=1 Tax=Orussus abietinus TaxID=222816 RepID=UPI000625122D|nr:TATA box-binding protein-associated factor RNA polymerase I subunit B [Orussus abietinus]